MYILRQYAEEMPDKPAIIMAATGEEVTYSQFEERANRLAHLFRASGLKPEDHMAFLTENSAEFFVIVAAADRAGLYYTPISTHLTPGEVEYIVDNCDAQFLLVSKAMADLAAAITDGTPKVETWLMMNGTIEGFKSYEEELMKYPDTPISDEIGGADMLYSSGTTGRPKGVLPSTIGRDLSAGNLVIPILNNVFKMHKETFYLSPAPLYHAAPIRFCGFTLSAGGTIVIMSRFDALDYLALIDKYKATNTQVVPTMFIRLLNLPEEDRKKYDVSSLEFAIHAAAPCPISIKEQMIDWWGPILFEYYAGTENNGFVCINSDEWLEHKGSVGQIRTGVIHILDDEGNELPKGVPGTVFFEGGGSFEYYKDPEKTDQSRSKEGWSTMGDIGFLDEEDYLYLTDRKADMIISGGINIYPQEAENVLILHPKVADVAVFGIPNEEFGEEVKAVVQPVDMSEAGPELEQEIINFCLENLSKIKCPRSVDFEAELPRTEVGKLLKRVLRDRYWEGKTRTGIVVPKGD